MNAKIPKRLEDIAISPEAARLFETAVDRATAPGANRRIAEAKAVRAAPKRRKDKRGAAS